MLVKVQLSTNGICAGLSLIAARPASRIAISATNSDNVDFYSEDPQA